ncbi:MAG: DUF4340 domain-containing protein [Planctomycetota bacterium]|jgi:hypothetical protein
MNQTAQTLKFVVAAVVMVVLAAGTHFMTQPTPLEGYGKVGESFFPDLDPSEATALRLISYNEDTATVRDFSVQKKDGVWTLPSYYNYPADGEDQLANTSTSLLGIKRGALVSRSPKDHERFGVIDPLSEEESSLKGRGQRLIIFKDNDIASADLIIGKEVPDRSGEHYVRVKDETETWICSLDVELSTKFSDWVEDDLLKMERDDLTKLEATSTVVDPQNGVSQKQEGVLTREKSADDWALAGINDEAEEVNTDDIRTMVNTLDNLKLTGIRRRPRSPISGVDGPLLLNDLTFNVPEQLRNNPDVDRQLEAAVQAELSENGFLMYRDPQSGNRRLLSQGGELIAATNDGVEYHLHFGSSFTGTDEEIEIGKQSSEAEAGSDESSDEESSDSDDRDNEATEESEEDETADDEPETTESRYLFVRAVFNESLLGEKPTEPVKPEVPEGVEVDDNGDVVEPDVDESKEEADDTKKEAEAADDKDGGEKTEEAPKLTPAEIYKKELEQYRKDAKTYESDLKGFEQKVKDGQEAVGVLNERFADWYYVISAEDFDKLALSRAQLVKEKEKPEPDSESSDAPAAESPAEAPAVPKTEVPDAGDSAKPDATTEAAPARTESEPAAAKPVEPAKADDAKASDDTAAKPSADSGRKEDASGDSQ